MQDFKHILAWQRAHALGISVFKCSRGFGRGGHSALRAQLTRSADSAAANIVEGCGASTNKEFARYLDISIKSLNETEYHLLAAHDHGLLEPELWRRLTAETIEIRKMVWSYRKKVLADIRGN